MIIPAESEMSWDESIHYWNAVGVSHPLSGYANKAEEWLYWHSGIGYGLPNSIDALIVFRIYIIWDKLLLVTQMFGLK